MTRHDFFLSFYVFWRDLPSGRSWRIWRKIGWIKKHIMKRSSVIYVEALYRTSISEYNYRIIFKLLIKIIRIANLRKTRGAQENYLSICHCSIITKVSFKQIVCNYSSFFTSEIKLQFWECYCFSSKFQSFFCN